MPWYCDEIEIIEQHLDGKRILWLASHGMIKGNLYVEGVNSFRLF